MSVSATGTTIVCAANRATLHVASRATVEHAAVVGVGALVAREVEAAGPDVLAGEPECVEPPHAAGVSAVVSAARASARFRRVRMGVLNEPRGQ